MERTFALVVDTLDDGGHHDGGPATRLAQLTDALVEARVPATRTETSTSLVANWTDLESWAWPSTLPSGVTADPDASWGHRRRNAPGTRDELFFGYYPQASPWSPRRPRRMVSLPQLGERFKQRRSPSKTSDPPLCNYSPGSMMSVSGAVAWLILEIGRS